jgi:membrane-associated phospholipid phosphatase
MLRKRRLVKPSSVGALVAGIVGIAALSWDLEISELSQSIRIPGDVRKAVQLSETFGHTIGVVAILGSLLWIDVRNRPKLVHAAWFTALGGCVANAAKYIIPRSRPHSLDRSPETVVSGWDTWGVPWTGSWFEEQLRSFPSGHSATAVALAIGLSHVYPRGRWCFAAMAAAACFQRLYSNAHFLSDIMGGIIISLLLSGWFWKTSLFWQDDSQSSPEQEAFAYTSIHSPKSINTE